MYGTTTAYGGSTGATGVGSGSADITVHEDLSALSPATTYHYRLVATSVAGTTYGDDATFTTPASVPVAPTVQTWAASDVGDTAVNIAGTFNPNGFSTTYWFEYGTTNAYGSTYSLPDTVVSGQDTVTVRLYDLQPSTTYHYRLVASNAAGTVSGNDLTFTTLADAPAVTTGAASAISTTGATLGGTVNPNGAATTYIFEYGTTTAYGSVTAATSACLSFALGGRPRPPDRSSSNTTYHYRLSATNANGTTHGADATFTTSTAAGAAAPEPAAPTPVPPVAGAAAVSAVAATSAALSGLVNPNGNEKTTACFWYGTASASGSKTPDVAISAGVPVTATLTGLVPGDDLPRPAERGDRGGDGIRP